MQGLDEGDNTHSWGTGELTALESEWETPCYRALAEAEPKGKPIRKAKASNTIRHLDDNELATASHLAGLRLPDASGSGIYAGSQSTRNE